MLRAVQAVAFGLAGLLLTLLGATATFALAGRNRIRDLEHERAADHRRIRDLRRELDQRARQRCLEGELVVVNTPKPDDQSIRGVVRLELPSGLLVLAGATYLERDVERGRAVVREVPAGEVVVAGPSLGSWVQVLYADADQSA